MPVVSDSKYLLTLSPSYVQCCVQDWTREENNRKKYESKGGNVDWPTDEDCTTYWSSKTYPEKFNAWRNYIEDPNNPYYKVRVIAGNCIFPPRQRQQDY